MSTRFNAAVMVGGRALASVAILVRGVILARIIGPDNMGIAATFMSVIAFTDMISFIGADKFLIRDPEGCEPKTVRTVQMITLARGILLSILMLGIAWPLSRMMETEVAILGYCCIALVPLLRGTQNLDWALQQRSHRPRVSILMALSGEWSAVLIGIAVAVVTGSWWASVAALLTQAIVSNLLSHALARSPWRVGFDAEVSRRTFQFGLPLLPSGILLFLAMQGDRFAVGMADKIRGIETYSLSDLGRYAIVANLAFMPTWIFSDLTYGVFLPWLAGTQDDRLAARRRGDLLLFYGILGVLMAFSAATIGGAVISAIIGPRYGDVGALIAIFSTAQALVLLRSTANVAAMAVGDSRNTLLGSAGRSLGLVLAIFTVFQGAPLEMVAGCAIAGEIIGLVLSEVRLFKTHRSRAGSPFRTAALASLVLLASAAGWFASNALGPWTSFATLVGAAGLLVGLGCSVSPTFRARAGALATLALRGRGAAKTEA